MNEKLEDGAYAVRWCLREGHEPQSVHRDFEERLEGCDDEAEAEQVIVTWYRAFFPLRDTVRQS